MYDTQEKLKAPYSNQRDFTGLMDTYEQNYIRLRCLIPDLNRIPSTARSKVPGCLDLHLELLECCKYTTTVLLTYHFNDVESSIRLEPNLSVKIYHDAQVAEALSGRFRHIDSLTKPKGRETVRKKWDLNRFLYKWLGYCLRQGHCFESLPTKTLDEDISSLLKKLNN